jgi:hypothetical protein
MRYIMHDYDDTDCQKILNHTKAAMSADSVILVDDVVLPAVGAHPYSLDKDIVMLANLGGAKERTERQWRNLFGSVGLELVSTHKYNDISGESVQMLRRAL